MSSHFWSKGGKKAKELDEIAALRCSRCIKYGLDCVLSSTKRAILLNILEADAESATIDHSMQPYETGMRSDINDMTSTRAAMPLIGPAVIPDFFAQDLYHVATVEMVTAGIALEHVAHQRLATVIKEANVDGLDIRSAARLLQHADSTTDTILTIVHLIRLTHIVCVRIMLTHCICVRLMLTDPTEVECTVYNSLALSTRQRQE